MTIAKLFIPAALVTGILVMTACSRIFSPEASVTLSHPEALPEGRPVCSDCHEEQQLKGTLKPYTVFNHTPLFIKDHRFSAGREVSLRTASSSVMTFSSLTYLPRSLAKLP